MDYIHADLHLSAGDIVRVNLDQQANVLLLDPINYMHFRYGETYRYLGGLATRTPYILRAPYSGLWHVVLNLGGAPGMLRYSIEAPGN